jgi:hypothetical protein
VLSDIETDIVYSHTDYTSISLMPTGARDSTARQGNIFFIAVMEKAVEAC